MSDLSHWLWCQPSIDMQHSDNSNGKPVKAIQALLQKFILVSSSFGTLDCEGEMWLRGKEKEREKHPRLLKCEYSLGWKPLPSLCKHMLFEFISLLLQSPAAPAFSLWQSCHACYFTENTIWYRRSPSSSICPKEKTAADEDNREQSGSDRPVREVIVSDVRHWRPLTFTQTLHNTEWKAAQSQRKPTNNVLQQFLAYSTTKVW